MNLLVTNRRPPRPAPLRYLRLRAAGLGSVKGVVLGRETGVAVGCDLTVKERREQGDRAPASPLDG
jgi:hypothetical protein